MSTGFPHHTGYYPPIPCLEVRLRAPDSSQSQGPIRAIVDTGADITLVSQSVLDRIAAPEVDEVRLRSHWGEATTVVTYLIDIQMGEDTLPGIEVAGDLYGDSVLLGRNVINKLVLLIDGPRHRTDLL